MSDEKINVETAFIVVKGLDGSYKAITDLQTPLELAREAVRGDIKAASSELLDALRRDEIALVVLQTLGSLAATPKEDTPSE